MYIWSPKLFIATLLIFCVVNFPSSHAASIKTSSVEAPEGGYNLINNKKLYRASDIEEDPKEAEIASTVVASSTTSTTTTQPPKKKPVLILIRDALKKVTNSLQPPTQQVTTNALQYFQLFEHFLQQAIEQVIDVVEESVDEVTTIKNDQVNSVDTLTTKPPETAEVSTEITDNPEKETSSIMPVEKEEVEKVEKEEEEGRTSL